MPGQTGDHDEGHQQRVHARQQADDRHDAGERADDGQQAPDVGQPVGLVAQPGQPVGDRRVLVQRDRGHRRRRAGSGRRARSARSCRPRCRPSGPPIWAARLATSSEPATRTSPGTSEVPAVAASRVSFTPSTVSGGRTAPATEVRHSSVVDHGSARNPVEIHRPMIAEGPPVLAHAVQLRVADVAGGLEPEQVPVAATAGHQLVVVALLDDPAVRQDADGGHGPDHGQPVGDHQRGHRLEQRQVAVDQVRLGGHVEGRRRLVQHHQPGALLDRPDGAGQREPLPLAPGEVRAARHGSCPAAWPSRRAAR